MPRRDSRRTVPSGVGRSAGRRGRDGHRAAPKRCAIYTRKSSEEGLEQDFNSLDAQREAGEAFARSQRHEGWAVLEDRRGAHAGLFYINTMSAKPVSPKIRLRQAHTRVHLSDS